MIDYILKECGSFELFMTVAVVCLFIWWCYHEWNRKD